MIGNISTDERVQIGRGLEDPFKGRLDEVRIYKTAVTQEWLTAERNNGSPSFLSFGPQEDDKP